MEISFEESKMLHSADKYFKTAIINIFKQLKENILRELKESVTTFLLS